LNRFAYFFRIKLTVDGILTIHTWCL